MEKVTQILSNSEDSYEDIMGFVLDYFQDNMIGPDIYSDLIGDKSLAEKYYKAKRDFDSKFWDEEIVPTMNNNRAMIFFDKMIGIGRLDEKFFGSLQVYLDKYYR